MLDVESFVAGSFVVTASQNLRMCDSHNARTVVASSRLLGYGVVASPCSFKADRLGGL